jgi:putative transposase
VIRTFRYPLRPTKAQEASLEEVLWRCRVLYNAALQERRDAYKKLKRTITRIDQQKSLTEVRRDDPEGYGSVSTTILRSALKRLDLAYKAFFRRCKAGEKPGFPRFRGRDRYDSFSLMVPPSLEDSKILIPKLGWIKFHEYRPLRGKPLDATIRKEGDQWFVSIQCDLGQAPEKVEVKSHTGIDLGLTHFATLSTGETIENPRFYREAEAVLARRQQILARRKRGSRSRLRAKRLVQRAHLHTKNQRLDFCRKEAKKLVSQYDLISHEDLTIRNMVRGNLGKSINDAGWAQFIHCIANKAEEAGKRSVGVNPRGTSQRCSRCAEDVPKGLSQRTHCCPHCGLVLDRDHNASINIDTLGFSVVNSQEIALENPKLRKVA